VGKENNRDNAIETKIINLIKKEDIKTKQEKDVDLSSLKKWVIKGGFPLIERTTIVL